MLKGEASTMTIKTPRADTRNKTQDDGVLVEEEPLFADELTHRHHKGEEQEDSLICSKGGQTSLRGLDDHWTR